MKDIPWQIYVVFHKNIVDDHYKCDPSFNPDYYTFLNTNINAPDIENSERNIIRERDFSIYNNTLQQKKYMAVSALYHTYKNNLHKRYDYIGFIEYDIELKFEKEETRTLPVTQHIEETIKKNDSIIIPLSYRHPFKKLHNIGGTLKNESVFKRIIKSYNEFFKTEYTLDKLLHENPTITSQQSFIADTDTFDRIMKFISHIIESKDLETGCHPNRPSFHLDRYIGITLELDSTIKIPAPLIHTNKHQW